MMSQNSNICAFKTINNGVKNRMNVECQTLYPIYPRPTATPVSPSVKVKVQVEKDELTLRKAGNYGNYSRRPYVPVSAPQGKMIVFVKAGILFGTMYITYAQGIWGSQKDTTECVRRFQEYLRSLNTRQPPTFDKYGNVVPTTSTESLIAPVYNIYKDLVTSCFTGIVKLPVIVKCKLIEYKNKISESKIMEDAKKK